MRPQSFDLVFRWVAIADITEKLLFPHCVLSNGSGGNDMDKKSIYSLAFLLAFASFAAHATTSTPETGIPYKLWTCVGACDYYLSDINSIGPGFVEKINVQLEHKGRIITELAKYRSGEVSFSGEDIDRVLLGLYIKCVGIALNSKSEFLGLTDEYAPRLIDPQTLKRPDSKKGLCF